MKTIYIVLASVFLMTMTACSNISGTVTSGGVGLPGVVITITDSNGNFCTSTITDTSGNYRYLSANGTYTVKPSMPGFDFYPESTSITVSDSNVVVQDFIGYIKTSFKTSDFSGKTIYYVNSEFYQACTFYPDGRATAGNMYFKNGYMISNDSGTWSVNNGLLTLLHSETGERVTYALLVDYAINRYWTVTKTTSSGQSVVGMFYDQITGKGQAKAFVEAGNIPQSVANGNIDDTNNLKAKGLFW